MTIGIRFLCNDAVVLCSDRQITSPGAFKYEEGKIFPSQTRLYSLIYSYAGVPEEAKVIFQRVQDSIPTIVKESTVISYIETSKAVLEKAYKSKHSKGLQTLLGLSIKGFPPFLLKTYGDTIVEGYQGETIGCGDTSMLKYLNDVLLPDDAPDVSEAHVLASYMVSVACRYVDGCSGGPDHKTIHRDGSITSGSGGIFPNEKERFAYSEQEIGRGLRELLLSGGTRTVITQPLPPPKNQP